MEMLNSTNLINNLLSSLDSLQIKTEARQTVDQDLQFQLNELKAETDRLTSQYTQSLNKTLNKKSSKKIPPPIITRKATSNKSHTIDDILFELNNVSAKAYEDKRKQNNNHAPTPMPLSAKQRKASFGGFVDPRRYSDPYHYTILSTLDENKDAEEEETNLLHSPTPKTPLPYYRRKNDYSLASIKSPKVSPTRNRSVSQPERLNISNKNLNTPTASNKINAPTSPRSPLHMSITFDCMELESESNSCQKSSSVVTKAITINNNNKSKSNNNKSKSNNDKKTKLTIKTKPEELTQGGRLVIPPPRSSSYHSKRYREYKLNKESLNNNKKSDRYYSDSSDSESERECENSAVYYECLAEEILTNNEDLLKCKNSGLENKLSFYSDITLINEEDDEDDQNEYDDIQSEKLKNFEKRDSSIENLSFEELMEHIKQM